jgi:hypothetical protein
MNNYDNDSVDFSDNYEDNEFFNDKSKTVESVKKSVDVPSKKVVSIKKSSNTIEESFNDNYDDDDWGDNKSASISAQKVVVDKPTVKTPTLLTKKKSET